MSQPSEDTATPVQRPTLAPRKPCRFGLGVRDVGHHHRAIKEAIARFTRRLWEERTAVTGGEIAGVRPLPAEASE